MQRRLFLVFPLVLAACMSGTSDEADPLAAKLVASKVHYFLKEDGAPAPDRDWWQTWNADGTTYYHSDTLFSRRNGRWKVENGRYCSAFGGQIRAGIWECWRVRFSAGGTRVRFSEITSDWLLRAEFQGVVAPRGADG